MPKVLISDSLSPAAVEIFRERGVDVDVKTGLKPDELKAIVTDAFKVNKEGKVDKDRILGLRRFQFDDDRWKRAMQAISDSVRVTRSKEYIRFYRRPAPDQDFVQIPLDLARV